ncbi:MAG: class I SAM-dependent methyltransferase [Deltaproteobacteria bacterium]|nr:class I SAM-dependent methyltransferase [Deltaproteobacteria bacterium]
MTTGGIQVEELKEAVRQHWQRQPCGTRDIPTEERRRFFDEIERERYEWEPYIPAFARFERGKGKRLLEVGVGAGTDFINWVRHGAIATGVDLTEAGVALTRERLALEELRAEVLQADAERLPFPDQSFDLVYSYGVLHHSPNTARAVSEVHRVLRPGGTALIMVYHVPSWVGFMLWGVHCAAKLRPWKSPRWAIFNHLESPGTKAYTHAEARELFSAFSSVNVRSQLSHGDLLLMRPAQKYQSSLARLAWTLYPRWAIKATGDRFGLGLFIEATR